MKKLIVSLAILFLLISVSKESYANEWVPMTMVTQQVVYQPVVYTSVQYYYVPVTPVLIYNPAPVWYRYKPWCCY